MGARRGSPKRHGICHSLILIWAEKYRKGELTLDVQREEQMQEAALKVADLERKVGQLAMERDRLKRGLAVGLPASNGSSSTTSGPGAYPSHGGAA